MTRSRASRSRRRSTACRQRLSRWFGATSAASIEQVFDRSLIDLPVAAADWTNGVLKREVNAYLVAHLPEFRADFDVTADTAARVVLTVYPRVPVVRTVDLSMRSDTLPNMLLLTHRERSCASA